MYKTKIFFKSMIIIFLLSFGYFISITLFAIPKIKNSFHVIEKANAKHILYEIVSISNSVYDDIKYFPKVAINIQKDNLKNLNHIAYTILENNYKRYKNGEITQARAKQIAYKLIGGFHYAENGYFFILDDKYKVVSHPNKKLLNKNYLNIKDDNGVYFAKQMIDEARENNESFVEYLWDKPGSGSTPKLSYMQKFKPWNVYVGTGAFIDNIILKVEARKKELYTYLYEKISNIKIAHSGYIYILNSKGDMLYHPNKNLQGKSIKKIKNPMKNTYLFNDLINAYKSGKKELHYLWNKPEDKEHFIYKKVSWIEYVKDLDWYIVSSVYEEEFERGAQELTESLLVIGLVLLLLVVLIASVFFKQLDVDISTKTQALIDAKKKLKELANVDLLTKLYNRRYLYYIVPKIVSLARREKKPLSILMIDLDKFKNINDTYGHANGDKVLELFADILRKHTRESDIAARIGGEEFLIILSNTSREAAFEVANKIRIFTKEQSIHLEDGASISFTISIGIDSVDLENEKDIDRALIRADKALYEAKENGRDRVC